MSNINLHKRAQLKGHRGAIYDIAPTDTGLWSGAGDGWIVHWPNEQIEVGKLIANVGFGVYSLAVLPEQQWVVAGDMNGGVHWVHLTDTTQNRDIEHHKKGVFDLFRYQDSLFSCGGDGCLTRWNTTTGRSIETLQLTTKSLRCITPHPILPHLAVAASDGCIYIIDANNLTVLHTILMAHLPAVFCVTYSPDGRYLLSGGRDAHLRIWDANNHYALLHAIPAHTYTLNGLVFWPDGQAFATCSRDRTIKIWDADTFALLRVIDTLRHANHINSVNKLVFLPDGSLASCSDDKSIIIWEL